MKTSAATASTKATTAPVIPPITPLDKPWWLLLEEKDSQQSLLPFKLQAEKFASIIFETKLIKLAVASRK